MSLAGTLRSRIRADMNNTADHMSGGGCADWDEYKHLSGLIEGLAKAERHLLDILEEMSLAESED